MNKLLLTLVFFCLHQLVTAQCSPVPPPPALDVIYAVDADNDGIAVFDIESYITNNLRPHWEESFGVSSSSYTTTFYNSMGEVSGPLYTNLVPDEIGEILFVYTGSGPQFMPLPPCYWVVNLYQGVRLTALPQMDDFDSDGIVNRDEDTNSNLNLMDDDYDSDGLENFRDDSDGMLAVDSYYQSQLRLYPNPVSNGLLNIESTFPISGISIFDINGKQLMAIDEPSLQINTENLAIGTYFVKIQSGQKTVKRTIIVE